LLEDHGRGLASAAIVGSDFALLASAERKDEIDAPKKFKHRGYLGWITDLASEPAANDAWPSMRLDERLLRDYSQTFDVMKRLGMNEISIWGLFVSSSWPIDITSCVSRERGAMVERLIETAHQRGIRVQSGLGVYSWGFDRIIEANPQLSRGNRRAMCAHEPKAWEWMRRVVDFAFERFPIDGVSMQSADQGRCPYEKCSVFGNAEYHARLNARVAEHIRERWPKKTIGINSWGTGFGDVSAKDAIVKLSRTVDYMIDSHDSSGHARAGYRKELIASLDCSFGTLGGPQVQPPQHWQRDRWFLPIGKRAAEHLGWLRDDGGSACEYFFHIMSNPGDEVSLWTVGKLLSDPHTPWQTHLGDTIEELYETRRASTPGALVELFVQAEDAHCQFLPANMCATINLEPLVINRPGPAIYLRDRLKDGQRAAYRERLIEIDKTAKKFRNDVSSPRFGVLLRCVQNTIRDLDNIETTSRSE